MPRDACLGRLATLVLLWGCEAGPPPTPRPSWTGATRRGEVEGQAVPVDPGAAPEGDPPPGYRLDDTSVSAHVGRAPRRLDLAQFRASLERVVGARWVGPRTVRTSAAPTGTRVEAEADLLDYYGSTLGRPDYVTVTAEVTDPTVSFLKLAADAARDVCAASVAADLGGRPSAERRVLAEVTGAEVLPGAEAAIRRNLVVLALRFWGLTLAPDGESVTAMLGVFRAATSQPMATAREGWRAVCVDLATDPRFMSY